MQEKPSNPNDYGANTDRILEAVLQGVRADDRFVGLLDCASPTGGRSEAFVNLDLVLLLRDEHAEAFKAECRAWAAQFGKLLVFIEGSGVAPSRAVYDTEPIPTSIDFTFAPLSRVNELSERLRLPARDLHSMVRHDTTNGVLAAALRAARPEHLQEDDPQRIFTEASGTFWYNALRTLARVHRGEWQAVWDDTNFVVLRNLQALLLFQKESTKQWYARDMGIKLEEELSRERMRALSEAFPVKSPGIMVHALTAMVHLGRTVCTTVAQRHKWEWPKALAARVIALYERRQDGLGKEQRIDWEELHPQSHTSNFLADEAIIKILGETFLRDAADYNIGYCADPGAQLAGSVLRNLRAWPAMQRCYEIFQSDLDVEIRENALHLLYDIGDGRIVPWIPEFLKDPDDGIQRIGVSIANNLIMHHNLQDPPRETLLSIMRNHPNEYAVIKSRVIDLFHDQEAFDMEGDRHALRRMAPNIIEILKDRHYDDIGTDFLEDLFVDDSIFLSFLEKPLAALREHPRWLQAVRRIDAVISAHQMQRERVLNSKLLPPGFVYPQQFVKLIRAPLFPDLEPWRLLAEKPVEWLWLLERMRQAYPDKTPIPFARSMESGGDIACFDGGNTAENPEVNYYTETVRDILPSMELLSRHGEFSFKDWLQKAKSLRNRSKPKKGGNRKYFVREVSTIAAIGVFTVASMGFTLAADQPLPPAPTVDNLTVSSVNSPSVDSTMSGYQFDSPTLGDSINVLNAGLEITHRELKHRTR